MRLPFSYHQLCDMNQILLHRKIQAFARHIDEEANYLLHLLLYDDVGTLSIRDRDLSCADISFLSECTGLYSITLVRCRMVELPDLSRLDGLRILDVSGNGLSRIAHLPSNLRVLRLSSNSFPVIPDLPSSLKLLDISDNEVCLVDRLPPNLEELYIRRNPIKSTICVSTAKRLKVIYSDSDVDGEHWDCRYSDTWRRKDE